ncbi:hypothetical protein D4764_05G0013880 [Takifugu flavidus]|uniref:Protein PAXX n=1 Tax=Takifugu flavidus TaxID=433684 RepID=A0A5C6N3C1_9TELE|nr:hypothetical protein D4764_05G0013880 [Takifugu flavidus]
MSPMFGALTAPRTLWTPVSACLRGDVSVVVGDTSAELCGGSSPGDPRLKLSRLEPPQAGEELKELLFTMADRLSQAEGASVFSSPKKNQHTQPAESGAEQNSGPTLTPKKRPARTSLINPGTKTKVEAAGVTFDDAED